MARKCRTKCSLVTLAVCGIFLLSNTGVDAAQNCKRPKLLSPLRVFFWSFRKPLWTSSITLLSGKTSNNPLSLGWSTRCDDFVEKNMSV